MGPCRPPPVLHAAVAAARALAVRVRTASRAGTRSAGSWPAAAVAVRLRTAAAVVAGVPELRDEMVPVPVTEQHLRESMDRWQQREDRATEARRSKAERLRLGRERQRIEQSVIMSPSAQADLVCARFGWPSGYIAHLAQPYCECRPGYDGWVHCQHAYDLWPEIDS
jgi:hypothetical protein